MSAIEPDFLPPEVESLTLGELACWRVRTGSAELLLARQGAQILEYRRHGEPPLIWLSEQAAFRRGEAVRGGVPVCWPWFGDLGRNPAEVAAPRPDDAPFHGLVRTLDWTLVEAVADADGVALAFELAPQALPGWPPATALRLAIRVGERLELALSSHNRGTAPVVISQALHSYFAVGDVEAVRVEGLEGCSYIETLDGWQRRRQDGALSISGETDRIYLDLPPRLTLVDEAWRRRLVLEASGSRSAVLWNPWLDKARRLSQFADDAWRRMLCIETANAMDDVVRLAPGARHTLGLTLTSAPL
ncbi:glucose-6-phosphate 1-epimerase [Crenobacter luteus]|uniref:D-hexose-6-phosphate mutarotase n=1 Tax=Crenobacter luteus TaxID=1452487 RepID=UPI00104B1EA9|nr:D-hexose-6-phosphate mutarotase [Crenobacter luteus]TCP13874.1 glucose-6-phosphate 1-epimerase [Crenobacter luteus]